MKIQYIITIDADDDVGNKLMEWLIQRELNKHLQKEEK